MAALVRDVERERLIEEALAERAAKVERERHMEQEFIERMRLGAEQLGLNGGRDAEDEEEEDDDDDDCDEWEEDEEEWERTRLRLVEADTRNREARRRLLDYDPKQGGLYYTRIYRVHDLPSFDHDEESPRQPMRYTDAVYKSVDDFELCEAVNIFSVKIGSLDIDFPIHVYGTVIARDSLDKKCVYLFRRDREDCQTITCKDESLILTGPKRGLALISSTYVETNLFVKGDERQEDKELSKGILEISGIERRVLKKCELETGSLATRLSSVDVMYGVVKDAVEATISIEILAGQLFGKITACASSIEKMLVLHDSRLSHITIGDETTPVVIPLLRSVVAVYVMERLLLTVATHTEDGEVTRCTEFIPKVNGSSLKEIMVGSVVLRAKVVWSIIDF